MHNDIPTLRRILHENRVIAVVGLSANWWRPSFFAAKYLQERGYRVVPVGSGPAAMERMQAEARRTDDAGDHEGAIEDARERYPLINRRRPVAMNPVGAQSHPRADYTRDREYEQ